MVLSGLGLDGFGWVWLGLDGFGWVGLGLVGFGWVWMGLVGFEWAGLGLVWILILTPYIGSDSRADGGFGLREDTRGGKRTKPFNLYQIIS